MSEGAVTKNLTYMKENLCTTLVEVQCEGTSDLPIDINRMKSGVS